MKILGVLYLLFLLLIFSSCQKIKNSFVFFDAEIAYNQGNFDKAIKLYKQLLEKNPDDPNLHYQLGAAYFSKGEKLKVQKQIAKLRKLGKENLAKDLEQLLERYP